MQNRTMAKKHFFYAIQVMLLISWSFSQELHTEAVLDNKTEKAIVVGDNTAPQSWSQNTDIDKLASTPKEPVEQYRIKKKSWSLLDEDSFSKWIETIGKNHCEKHPKTRIFKNILNDKKLNPLAELNPTKFSQEFKPNCDCSDFPLLLRAYYAYIHGLPFNVTHQVTKKDPNANTYSKDTRYSSGNLISKKVNFHMAPPGKQMSLGAIAKIISQPNPREDIIDSRIYRVGAQEEASNENFPDFYSPSIQWDSVRPGTVIYDHTGHIAIVYKVDENGKAYVMDGHPGDSMSDGGSITCKTLPQLELKKKANIEMGSHFKNFRPSYLHQATQKTDAEGNTFYSGGTILGATNQELEEFGLFSLAQYENGLQTVLPKGLEYLEDFDPLWLKLGKPPSKQTVLKEKLNNVCETYKERVDSIEQAREEWYRRSYPSSTPTNIHNSIDAFWEGRSTPSRDSRSRAQLLKLNLWVRNHLNTEKDPAIQMELKKIFFRESSHCILTYTDTRGNSVKLNLKDIVERVPHMSIDPYQCPERRWGETDASLLKVCDDFLKENFSIDDSNQESAQPSLAFVEHVRNTYQEIEISRAQKDELDAEAKARQDYATRGFAPQQRARRKRMENNRLNAFDRTRINHLKNRHFTTPYNQKTVEAQVKDAIKTEVNRLNLLRLQQITNPNTDRELKYRRWAYQNYIFLNQLSQKAPGDFYKVEISEENLSKNDLIKQEFLRQNKESNQYTHKTEDFGQDILYWLN